MYVLAIGTSLDDVRPVVLSDTLESAAKTARALVGKDKVGVVTEHSFAEAMEIYRLELLFQFSMMLTDHAVATLSSPIIQFVTQFLQNVTEAEEAPKANVKYDA